MEIYLLSFISALVISYISILGISKIFTYFSILDNPKKYKKKRNPIPYSVGIIFIICFIPLSFLYVDYSYKLFLIWMFGSVITLVSFADDMLHLSAKMRLIIQIIIGLTIGITSIKIGYISNIFG